MRASTILRAVAFLLLALLSPYVAATAQAPDIIIIDGQSERLHTNPLSRYLADHPNVLPESDVMSSGNWRGYVATWEVSKDSLLLRKIDVEFSDPKSSKDSPDTITRNVISDLFPASDHVVATWYSGALVIPRGEIVNYVHMGYGSTYERYTIVKVKDGLVTTRIDLNAKDFEAYKRSKFEAFKQTTEYAAKLRKIKADDPTYTDELAESFLFSFESEHYMSVEYGPKQ